MKRGESCCSKKALADRKLLSPKIAGQLSGLFKVVDLLYAGVKGAAVGQKVS